MFPADIASRGSVIVTGRRFRAVHTAAPFDFVQVEFQNAPLAEDEFGDGNKRELGTLAEERAARSEEQVFYELLRKRGTSAQAAALHIVFGGDFDRVPIESMMLVKASVFRRNDGVLQIRRDLGQRNELILFVIRRVVNPGLQTALHVHRSGWWVDPAHSEKAECDERP